MLDSAGKRVAEQGQLQFLEERRERLTLYTCMSGKGTGSVLEITITNLDGFSFYRSPFLDPDVKIDGDCCSLPDAATENTAHFRCMVHFPARKRASSSQSCDVDLTPNFIA